MEYLAPITHGILNGNLAVSGSDTAYTGSWILTRKHFFGLEVQFSSDTDVNVQVYLEQSNDNINFVTAIDILATITDEEIHLLPVAPVVAVYARLKLVGISDGDGEEVDNSIATVLTKANWVEVES